LAQTFSSAVYVLFEEGNPSLAESADLLEKSPPLNRLIDIDATEEADKLGRSIRETPREDEWRQGALNHGRVWSNT